MDIETRQLVTELHAVVAAAPAPGWAIEHTAETFVTANRDVPTGATGFVLGNSGGWWFTVFGPNSEPLGCNNNGREGAPLATAEQAIAAVDAILDAQEVPA